MQTDPTRRATRITLITLALTLSLCWRAQGASAQGEPALGTSAQDAQPHQEASAELQTGISLLHRKSYALAAAVLRKAVENSPDDPNAAYYLGVALNRTTAGKEAESLLKRGLGEHPESPEVNFELGLHYFDKEVTAEASDYFEQVIYLAPAGPCADQARAYLKKIEEAGKPRRWELSVLGGLQYDSNVILSNDSTPLPAGYAHRGDLSAVVNLRGSYAPIRSGALEVTAGYSFYQNLHTSLTAFDTTQNLLDLSASYAVTPNLRLKGSYSLEYLLLAGKPYNYSHNLSSSISRVSERWGISTLDYHYSAKQYWNSEKFSTNTDQNGDNNLIGLSQLRQFSKYVTLWVLYSHDVDATRNQVLGYHGNRALLGCRLLLPFALVGDLSGDVYHRQYGGTDPAFGVRRQDTQNSVSLTLLKNFSDRYSLSLGEVFSRNLSNIADFAYSRAITSALFSARF